MHCYVFVVHLHDAFIRVLAICSFFNHLSVSAFLQVRQGV